LGLLVDVFQKLTFLIAIPVQEKVFLFKSNKACKSWNFIISAAKLHKASVKEGHISCPKREKQITVEQKRSHPRSSTQNRTGQDLWCPTDALRTFEQVFAGI
jgi:hypothetical protein